MNNTKNKKTNKKGIIFSDYDGTLYDLKNKVVPEGTWQSFKDAKDAGYVTCLVTGRPEDSFKKVMSAEMRAGFNYIATDNGARLYEVVDGELHMLHVALLEKHVIESINNYIKETGTSAVHNGVEKITKSGNTLYPENEFIWKDDLEITIQDEAIQVNLDGLHPSFMPEYQQNWHPTMTTFSSKAGKALTVEHIKGIYPNVMTYAFGDECNDINMFKSVDLGIAMDHANDELKKFAKATLEPGYKVPLFVQSLATQNIK